LAQTAAPTLECTCGAKIDITSHRIGDTVTCSACGKPRVVIRSKVLGDVAPAGGAPAQATSDRLTEVQATLERIRVRRAGRSARDLALYPTWAVLLGSLIFGVFTGGYMAAQNMVAVGKLSPARAYRSVVYLALVHAGLFLLYLGFGAGTFDAFRIPPDSAYPGVRAAIRVVASGYVLVVMALVPLVLAAGVAPVVRSAREAGARTASPLVPMLTGFLLLIAQLFAVKFVALAVSPW
jgi:hypothetical protein